MDCGAKNSFLTSYRQPAKIRVYGQASQINKERKMKFINMTPHTINVVNSDGEAVANFAPSGEIARLTVTREKVGEFEGVEVFTSKFGEPSPLPAEKDGVAYIVSALYANGLRAHGDKRTDIYVPGEAKRNEAGQVVGCNGLNVA